MESEKGTNKILDFFEKYYYPLLALIFITLLFNLFYKINVQSIDFDEARHGINAYEMIRNGDYIINTYGYNKDYWNLKPPISFWAVIIGYKLLGFNTLGLRISSIISAIITIAMVTKFTKDKHGKTAAVIAAAMMTSFGQPILWHCSRGGEADSLYVLFFSAAVICSLLIDKGYKYLYLACFFAAQNFLTKSWHVLPVCATIGLNLIYSGHIKKMKLKEWLLAILSFLLPILTWALLRYSRDGITFFKEMIEYDLLKRSSTAIEGHTGNAFYYIRLVGLNYLFWLLLLVVAVILLKPSTFKSINKKKWPYILGVTSWYLLPIVLYSMASTKIEWYILPIYPPFAILCAAAFSAVLKNPNIKAVFKKLFTVALVMIFIGYEGFIVYRLSNYKTDSVQLALKEIGQSTPYKGYKLYTAAGYYSESGIWQQAYLLSAELYGDFIPCQGGLTAFLEDSSKDSLLFIAIDDTAKQYIEEYKLKIVTAQSGFYLLAKDQ